jgi:succinyl-diaminopimelate desuccinylase
MADLADITALTEALVSRPSVTPDDAGCQELLGRRLRSAGFSIETMRFGAVDNLWAIRDRGGPVLMFAGHTDVVPTGDLDTWDSDPFVPEIRDGMLFGRGAADMKGSLAAMLAAVEQFVDEHPDSGSIAFLITSDEEGPATDGTVRVVEALQQRQQQIDYCVIGEPSSSARLGDVIRVGRRGSLNGRLHVQGIQGHVAYPTLARNPIHAALPMLTRLTSEHWDSGNDDFPPTSLQISNIAAGTGATNVIPATLLVDFNLRFCTAQTSESLQARIEALCAEDDIEHHIDWALSGNPFLTPKGRLLTAVDAAVQQLQGFLPQHSTGGGTSDGRFIAAMGCELIELGPVNETIHQINECVSLNDLKALSDIYHHLLVRLLTTHA